MSLLWWVVKVVVAVAVVVIVAVVAVAVVAVVAVVVVAVVAVVVVDACCCDSLVLWSCRCCPVAPYPSPCNRKGQNRPSYLPTLALKLSSA
jgi:hypothetical protein